MNKITYFQLVYLLGRMYYAKLIARFALRLQDIFSWIMRKLIDHAEWVACVDLLEQIMKEKENENEITDHESD